MQVILFNVKHSRLVRYTSGVIASDSYERLKFEFNFKTDDWASVSIKTANFQYAGKTYHVNLDENNQVMVPAAVLNAPAFKVSIFGGGLSTESVKIPVKDCGVDNPETEFNPDSYLGEVINKITAMVDAKADALVFNPEDKTIQLAANGKPICDKVPVDADGIDECYINGDGNLILTMQDGSTINVGQVVDTHGNNYTLASNGAEKNIIEVITVNGTTLPVTDKTVNVVVPTGAMASKDNVSKDDLAEALKTEIEGKLDAAKVTGDMITHNASEFALAEHNHENIDAKTLAGREPSYYIDYQNFINVPDIPDVPTKTSDITNDSGFITIEDVPKVVVPTKTSELVNDSGFVVGDSIPTKTSELTNDSGFITVADIPDVEVPTKTSELINDSGFATEEVVDKKIADLVDSAPEALDTLAELAVAIKSHEDEYDALLETIGNKANTSDIPKKTSDLANDNGFITINDIPSVDVPTKTSQLTNDSGFITIDDIPEIPEIPEPSDFVATTKDEMEALLTEANIGKMVSYIGEDYIGGLVGTPFEVGDVMTEVYCDITSEPDLSKLTYAPHPDFDYDDGMLVCTLLHAPVLEDVSPVYIQSIAIQFTMPNGDVGYMLGFGTYHGDIWVYFSFDIPEEGIKKGWHVWDEGYVPAIPNDAKIDFNNMVPWDCTVKIESIENSEILSQFLSKTPFVKEASYYNNSLYMIVDESQEGNGIVAKNISEDKIIRETVQQLSDTVSSIEVNSLVAKSEEEFNGMTIEDNVGKTVSYNGQLYLITKTYLQPEPIKPGDEISTFYINKDCVFDFTPFKNPGSWYKTTEIEDSDGNSLLYVGNTDYTNMGYDNLEGLLNDIEIKNLGTVYTWSDDFSPSDIGSTLEEWGWEPRAVEKLKQCNWMLAANDLVPGKDSITIRSADEALAGFISKTPFFKIEAKPIQNMLIAKSEDEMDAFLTEQNIGKTISYVGENFTGELVGTPFNVGDDLTEIYFNTDNITTPFSGIFDFEKVDYSSQESYGVPLIVFEYGGDYPAWAASVAKLSINDMTNGELGGFMYMLVSTLGSTKELYFWSKEATPQQIRNAGGYVPDSLTEWGWNPDYADVLANGIVSSGFRPENKPVVSQVNYYELWKNIFSAKPFAERASKYKKNTLYMVVDDTKPAETFNVGDDFTSIYFNTNGVFDFEKVDYSSQTMYGVPLIILETSDGGLACIASAFRADLAEITNGMLSGHVYMLYHTISGTKEIYYWSNDVTPQQLAENGITLPITEWGWNYAEYADFLANGMDISSEITPENGLVVSHIAYQELWNNIFTRTPFQNESNIIAKPVGGSTTTEVVEQNVCIATNEEEIEKLLVPENVGKIVTYVGESTSGGGTPFKVGDKISTFHIDATKQLDFNRLHFDNAIDNREVLMKFSDSIGEYPVIYANMAEIRTMLGADIDGYLFGLSVYDGANGGKIHHVYYYSPDVTAQELINAGAEIPVTEWGWNPSEFEFLEAGVITNREQATVTYIEQQELWNGIFSKEPFVVDDIKYKNGSAYVIAEENGSIVAKSQSIDAETLGGQDPDYYLNYKNFINVPEMPEAGDKIEMLEGSTINLASLPPEIGVIADDGIHYLVPEVELELADGRLVYMQSRNALPITAGAGVEFKKNPNNTVSINVKEKNYGVENVGKFLVVGDDGNVVAESMTIGEDLMI